MNVMKMKEIIAEHEKIGNGLNELNLKEVLENADRVRKMSESVEDGAEKFKTILLQKIPEKTFVEFMEAMQTLTLSAMASNGCGFTLLQAHASGDLEGYTHTVLFSVIGVLINEEIL